ncbi:MAG: hypothetical protein ACI8XB_001793 [Patiriisocius sp.]
MHYCGTQLQYIGDCQSNTPYQLLCDNFSAQCLYMDSNMIKTEPVKIIKELEAKLQDEKKEEIAMFSFGQKMMGCLISYTENENEKVLLNRLRFCK